MVEFYRTPSRRANIKRGQSNIGLIKSFVLNGGVFELPSDDLVDESDVSLARRSLSADPDGVVSPQSVTRGLSLHSAYVPGSSGFGSVVVVDWLSFTLPTRSLDEQGSIVYEMRSLFGGGADSGRGYRGYTNCFTVLAGSGRVAWHPGRLEMGVHVDLPSSALKLMDSEGILGDVQDFLEWLLQRDSKISRLDVAIDTDKIDMSVVWSGVVGETFVSRCTWVSETKRLRDGRGHTVYIGAPTADRRMRFYDKAAEQNLDGVIWTRAEIQHRDKYAYRLAVAIASKSVDIALCFNDVCDFRVDTGDTNVSRRPRCDWWSSWLGSCREKIGFTFDTVEKSVNRVFDWLQSQVAPSLSMLAVASPEILLWLSALIDVGFTRLDAGRRDRAALFHSSGLSLALGSSSSGGSYAYR